ncbi:MAG TPA: murein biosynthesis integral membrane protein MurJ [Acidimicrobiales bacterium]|jgi:putative peptidoglycan lipid II flippase|nr:murein biosynthesis integral membrane protein MurJ [Acidimicrobiales bacterium]
MSQEVPSGGGAGEVTPVRLGRSAMVMAVGTTLSRLTGLGRFVALAFALGVAESRLADSYNIANTMPNVIYELVLGGVLSSVFIPVVVQELRTRAHDDAWESVSVLVSVSMVVLVGLSVVGMLVAPAIIHLFTLRLSGPEAARQQALATFFLRVFAPQVAFYGLAAIAGALLNAHDRFAVPMFAPVLNNVVVIATCLAFAAVVHGTPTDASIGADLGEKVLLALGTTAGVAVMAVVQWPFVRRLPGRLRLRVDFGHPVVRKLGRLSAWTLAYVVINQIGFGVILFLANGVQGGPSAFFVAFAFFQLPYGVVAVSIMTALVPTLAARHVEGDIDGFRSWLAGGLRATFLVLFPATAGYLVLSRPLIQTLLQHGVASSASTPLVSSVLDMFALGLVPFSAFLVMLRAFYARQDARTPVFVNIASTGSEVVFALVLFPRLDVRGLALAHSLSYLVGAVVAAVVLSRRLGGLEARHTMRELVKVGGATLVATGAMLGAKAGVQAAMAPGGGRALAEVVLAGGAGAVAFVVAARAFAAEDMALVMNLVPGRFRPRVAPPDA